MSDALTAQLERIEREAAQGCGLSDVVWESRVQAAYSAILADAPEAERPAIERVLHKHGYRPDRASYVSAAGECALTGIEVDFCPCGRHP